MAMSFVSEWPVFPNAIRSRWTASSREQVAPAPRLSRVGQEARPLRFLLRSPLLLEKEEHIWSQYV
jgi:hypothetical protein